MPGDLVLPFRIAAAALPPYLSASGGQLFIALRATAESLRCAAFTCVALAPCSFAWRKGVRSHPLRGAYRACCAGRKCRVGFTSTGDLPDCGCIWWAYLDLNQGPRPYQGRALTN